MCQMSNSKDASGIIHDAEATNKKLMIPSKAGVFKYPGTIGMGLVGLTILYYLVLVLNPEIPVSSEHCEEEEPCYRSDLLAYKVVSIVTMSYMGLTGVYNWNQQQGQPHSILKDGDSGAAMERIQYRLFGYIPSGEIQSVAIFIYQVWDFIISWSIPEHCDIIFMSHHFLTGLTAFYSLQFQYNHYYAIYFGGCSEFSSIFLVLADLDQLLPHTFQNENAALVILLCKAAFVMTFTYYRVYQWLRISRWFWSDALFCFSRNMVSEYRPGQSYILYMFLGLNILLSSLQLYWFGKIVQEISKMVS